MPRGRKPNYKGRSRQFNSGEEIERQKKEDTWRKKKEEVEEESEEDDDDDEESGSDDSDNEGGEKKGNAGIEIENPNHVKNKMKKAGEITAGGAEAQPELSRREREAIEKEQARQRYEKLHAEGKTDEARADLARLAIIRKQREEAAKKKQLEKEEREAKLAEAEDARRKAMEAQAGGEGGGSGKKKRGKR